MMDIERRLYYYGLGAGIPYRALSAIANAADLMRSASDVLLRRRLAREMLVGSPWVGFISKKQGYALVNADTLPGSSEALDATLAVIEDRRKKGWNRRPNNPFYQLERPEDYRNYPALIDFALSDAVLHIVSDYYGMVPQLKSCSVWLTPPQERQFSSQLFHLDKPEARIVGLFLNAETIGEDAGPLTLLPADVSQTVRRRTMYETNYFRHDGRLSDADVFKHCPREKQVMLGGAAGTGGFADTSNCFHFGSRCRTGERKMLAIKFMLPHKARETLTPIFDQVPYPSDEVRRLVLSGAAFHKRVH